MMILVFTIMLTQSEPITHARNPEEGTPIRVLQYNVQFLTPDFLSDLGFKFPDHFPDTAERAHAIGRKIACYDIISLNETINNDRRREIIDAMNEAASECGHAPLLPNSQYFNAVHGPDLEKPYPLGFDPLDVIDLLGTLVDEYILVEAGIKEKCDSSVDDPITDDELTIISRFPIIETHSYIFSQSECVDSAAAKGVLHARLWRGGNFPADDAIDIFATHLQAGFPAIKEAQIRELAKFVRSHNDPTIPAIIMGDFNINGLPEAQNDPDSDYNKLMHILRTELEIKDVGLELGSTNQDGTDRIDYIFISPFTLQVKNVKVEKFPCRDLGVSFCSDTYPTLSDHAAVEAEMVWRPRAVALKPELSDPKILNVNISRLKLLSTDSCNEFADFRGKLTIDDGFSTEGAAYFDVEGNDIGPDWLISKRVEAGVEEVMVKLEITDEDDLICGGRDDTVDVNPLPEEKQVWLRINLAERLVYLITPQGDIVENLAAVSQPFSLEGTTGREVGRMTALVTTERIIVEDMSPDSDHSMFLTVENLQATSADACDPMEFYGTLKFENGADVSRDFGIFDHGDNITPGWYVNTTVPAGRQSVDAFIRVRDEDDAFCGGGDDDVDVNPDSNQTAIKARIDLISNQIYLLDNNGNPGDTIGVIGSPITLEGFNGAETAKITFRIAPKSAILFPPVPPPPPPDSDRPLMLTIDRLQALSEDSCTDMDWFGTVRLENGVDASFSVGEDDNIDSNDFVPSWRVSGIVPAGVPTVDAYIKIEDDDDAVCGGSNDIVHVNPDSEDVIRIRIDLISNKIHLLYNDGILGYQVGVIGQPITLRGYYPDETGRITFRVDFGPQINYPPSLELNVETPQLSEREPIAIAGSLVNPKGWLDPFTVTVDWGDGSPLQYISKLVANFTAEEPLSFRIAHTYAEEGSYIVKLCGSDGNKTACSELDLHLNQKNYQLYFPVITKSSVEGTDLTIEALIATSEGVTITIKNVGNRPVNDAFWIDVYYKPRIVPGLNQPCDTTIADACVVWGIALDASQPLNLPIEPDETRTLTLPHAFFGPKGSNLPPYPVGVEVYALIDSVDFTTTHGAVSESKEDNNLFGPVISVAGSGSSFELASNDEVQPADDLPSREKTNTGDEK